MPEQVISIHGVPRSGTSWLGQIFNSHPDVAYRYQPLFSYRFKDRIGLNSSKDEILQFLNELYDVTDDEFILNKKEISKNIYPKFQKKNLPAFLVMKMVRYHHLIRLLINNIEGIKVIGIVRNPCAVIYSWLSAPREFLPEWSPMEEWRFAPKKNQCRVEEFFGFEKWKEVAEMFLDLSEQFPDRFNFIRYEDLATNPKMVTANVFEFTGLDTTSQVADFVNKSQDSHIDDPYAVYKKYDVMDRWKFNLDERIKTAIFSDLKGTDLEIFLK